jgi:hypothetical protein
VYATLQAVNQCGKSGNPGGKRSVCRSPRHRPALLCQLS